MNQLERIAALETEVKYLRKSQAAIVRSQQQIATKQNEILQELARYRGAVGVLMLGITAIWSAALLMKDWIFAQFKG